MHKSKVKCNWLFQKLRLSPDCKTLIKQIIRSLTSGLHSVCNPCRLRGSRVLLAGLGGLGAEVAKNLILAGVKGLTLLDHEQVNKQNEHKQIQMTVSVFREHCRSEANLSFFFPNVRHSLFIKHILYSIRHVCFVAPFCLQYSTSPLDGAVDKSVVFYCKLP